MPKEQFESDESLALVAQEDVTAPSDTESPEEAFVQGLSMPVNRGDIDNAPTISDTGVRYQESSRDVPTSVVVDAPPSPPSAEPIAESIASSYQERFGITPESLESIPGFSKLTPPQQKLVMENLMQLTIGRIHEEALDGHQAALEEEKKSATAFGSAFLGKVWVGVRESFMKQADIASREKATATALRTGGIAVHRQTLEQLVSGITQYGPEVIEKDGQLEIQLLETTGLSPELASVVRAFNQEGNAFAKIPYEWSLPNATASDRAVFERAKETDLRERASVLAQMEQEGGKELAVSAMAQTEAMIEMERFMKTSPDAVKELEAIESQGVWTAALKSVATERGLYMAGGAVARAALGAVVGLAAAPAAAMMMGSVRGWHRSVEAITQEERDMRRGKQVDSEEVVRASTRMANIDRELTLNPDSALRDQLMNERAGLEAVVRGTKTNMIESGRTDARLAGYRGAVEKIEALVSRIEDTPDPHTLSQLRRRVAYIKQKVSEGKMIYGEDKQRIANQYALLRSIAEAEAVLATHDATDAVGDRTESRLLRMLGKREEEIRDARFKKKLTQATKAGLIGATFAYVGAAAADASGGSLLNKEEPVGAISDSVDNMPEPPILDEPAGIEIAPAYVVMPGDTLGRILANELGITEREAMAVLLKMSPDALREAGVTSGDMNRIVPGDTVQMAPFQEVHRTLPPIVSSPAPVAAMPAAPATTPLEPIPLSYHDAEESSGHLVSTPQSSDQSPGVPPTAEPLHADSVLPVSEEKEVVVAPRTSEVNPDLFRLQSFLGRTPAPHEMDAYMRLRGVNATATKDLLLAMKAGPLTPEALTQITESSPPPAIETVPLVQERPVAGEAQALIAPKPLEGTALIDALARRPHADLSNTITVAELGHTVGLDTLHTGETPGKSLYSASSRILSYTEHDTWNTLGRLRTEGSGPELAREIARVERALALAMHTSKYPLTTLEIYKVLESEKLAELIPLPNDPKVEEYRIAQGLPPKNSPGTVQTSTALNQRFDPRGMDKYPPSGGARPSVKPGIGTAMGVLKKLGQRS